jgi:hypothetical protein
VRQRIKRNDNIFWPIMSLPICASIFFIIVMTVPAQTTKEKQPEVFTQMGQTFKAGPCGWNGNLQDDGKCHIRIVFPSDYPPVTCKARKVLPEEGKNEGQIIECIWEPR